MKPGDKVWVLTRKGKFVRRTIEGIAPYHVSTKLLKGEPTSNPKTGMFICSKHYLKQEVGFTKHELLGNLVDLERSRIETARIKTLASKDKIEIYIKMANELSK